ncbi:MAG: hypothetical protein U0744_06035 [Gemmataceae bacterium]
MTLTGVESGASVEYSIDGGTTWLPTFTATEGANSVEVRQTDVAGNVSIASIAFAFTLDTTVPAAPTVALTADTGFSGADKITSNGALTLTGVESGATVQYSIDGGTTWTGSFTPVEGANSVQVRQTDIAGNPGLANRGLRLHSRHHRSSHPWRGLTTDTGIVGDKLTSNGALTLTGVEVAVHQGRILRRRWSHVGYDLHGSRRLEHRSGAPDRRRRQRLDSERRIRSRSTRRIRSLQASR